MSLEVWHEHKVLKAYPDGTPYEVDELGKLSVGGDEYRPGEWSAYGKVEVCAFLTPDSTCPNCYPAEPS